MDTPVRVKELVERFDANRDDYRTHYNETQVRREFVDPLFKALGWDVDNEQGYAELYKDVIHEDSIKVGAGMKAPDYCFRVGSTRKFFVETKKPSVKLKEAGAPAFQVRRYAYSSKLPLSILTDFEELVVYDCRKQPQKDDSASTGRILYFTCEEYLTRWDEFYGVFSRDSVLKGSFDRFAESVTTKRGTAEVDQALLREIEKWRASLAANIALRNRFIRQRELNFAVQRIIDRILFLRICEDRGIEPYGQLQSLIKGKRLYKELCKGFVRADERYNSGLFHFRKEHNRAESPDNLTLNLELDDKPLAEILSRLYYPNSPYEFSVLPTEILGQVYEQFLGRVIRLTTAHRAVIEEKPEVKKAGGVYYTPTHIVAHIVEGILKPLLKDKDPREISGETGGRGKAPLRVLDPACGSGSFLIAAYQLLLDWYFERYINDDPERWARKRDARVMQDSRGEWRLTTYEKKRILLTHIFGVDIDAPAVEVTKLSLLLKVLEGENAEVLAQQLRLFHDRALPDLGSNIKCGNSLVDSGFYEAQQELISENDNYQINAFDWEDEFPETMRSGGFHAVVTNPPWLMAGYYVKDTLDYLRAKYVSAEGKFDLYYIFLERACKLVRRDGRVGMIIPNKLFHTSAASSLRHWLDSEDWVESVIDFRAEKVFPQATNYSAILFLSRSSKPMPHYSRTKADLRVEREFTFPRGLLAAKTWLFADKSTLALFEKVEGLGEPLEQLASRFGNGVQSGADRILLWDRDEARRKEFEWTLLKPLLRGRDVRRYGVSDKAKMLIFPYKAEQARFRILSEGELRKYPHVFEYLKQNRTQLAKRVWFDRNAEELSGKWYGLMYLDSLESFQPPHLLTPSLSDRSNFAIGTGNLFVTGTAGVSSVIPRPKLQEDILYLLGILNSRLLSFYAVEHSPIFQGGYFKFSAPYLRSLPIRRIDFSSKTDVTNHQTLIDSVRRRIKLEEQKASVRTSHEEDVIRRQIVGTDERIDRIVYELYELSATEIDIVEENEPLLQELAG